MQSSTITSTASLQKSLIPKPPAYPKKKKQISETQKLELENKKMEDRLNSLKEYLKTQKEKRLATQGQTNGIWRKGFSKQPLSLYGKDVLVKKNEKLKKINTPPAAAVADVKTAVNETQTLIKDDENVVNSVWRVPSSLGQSSQDQPAISFLNDLDSIKIEKRTRNIEKDLSCLNIGDYNEEEAHEDFQKALMEWRNGSMSDKEIHVNPQTIQQSEAGTITESVSVDNSELIKHITQSSTTYMEKLLLTQYRSGELEFLKETFNESNNVAEADDDFEEFTKNNFELIQEETMPITPVYACKEAVICKKEIVPNFACNVKIVDITDFEDECIENATKRGRMIEIIEKCNFTVVEPDDG